MKMPIEWHEECLKNMKKYLEGLYLELERKRVDIVRLERDISTAELKIKTAKEKGKKEFDSERFMVKREKRDAR